jgi:hypothetical protein
MPFNWGYARLAPYTHEGYERLIYTGDGVNAEVVGVVSFNVPELNEVANAAYQASCSEMIALMKRAPEWVERGEPQPKRRRRQEGDIQPDMAEALLLSNHHPTRAEARDALFLLWHVRDGFTQDDLAYVKGISQQRAGQILQAARKRFWGKWLKRESGD